MRELLPHVEELIDQKQEVLLEALNSLAEAGQVLGILTGDQMNLTKPMVVEVSEGKYRGELLPLVKVQISSTGIIIWGMSAGTGKPVQVRGLIKMQVEEPSE